MSNYTEALQTSISNATEKLEQEQQQLATTLKKLKKQTPVTYSSLLASITLAQQNVNQSVTRSAVNASNVQVLAAAVLHMASDTGSILSIINAQDYDTTILTLAKNANELADKAAYTAERISQMGMECSMLAAELRFTGILEKFDSTSDKKIVAELKTVFAAAVVRAQKLSSATNELTQHIKELAFQLIEAAGAAEALETLISRNKAKNHLLLSELVNQAAELNADTGKIFKLLPLAVQSGYAANSAAIQTAAIGVWINTQFNLVN